MMSRLRTRKGFTLVELMIVVAIIGILAAIAIPNFLQFRMKAKTSEAKSNLGAIRSTQVAYVAEWNSYVGGLTAWTPDRTIGATAAAKISWNASSRFSILGFAPEGNVYFSYNMLGADYPITGFTSNAFGDLDSNGTGTDWSVYTVNNTTTEITHSGAPF
jgi:type IV pilus assembly protein PilA